MTIRKQNPAWSCSLISSLPTVPSTWSTLSNYAYTQIIDPLKRLPGVGDVRVFGERRYSMRVWLDPDRLAQLEITAVDVQNAIAEQNIQVAAGKIGQSPTSPGTAFEMQVSALGRLSDPAQFGDIVVRANPRRARRFVCAMWPASNSAHFNIRRPGSGTISRQSRSRSTKAPARTRWICSGGSRTRWRSWRGASQKASIRNALRHDPFRVRPPCDICFTLAEALLLVVFVVFIFLQAGDDDYSDDRHPGVAHCDARSHGGFPVLAQHAQHARMVLAIGLVVDDAIVVVENVERQLEAGLKPLAAAREAMHEVTGPIIATTGVLMAVFIPVAFIPGVAGTTLQPVCADGRDLRRHFRL